MRRGRVEQILAHVAAAITCADLERHTTGVNGLNDVCECGYVCDEEEIMQPASGVGLRGYVEAGFRFPRLVGAAVGRLDIKAEHAVGSDGHNQRVTERVRYYRTTYPCLSLISKLHSATNVCGPSCMRRWEITVDASRPCLRQLLDQLLNQLQLLKQFPEGGTAFLPPKLSLFTPEIDCMTFYDT